MFYFPLLFAFVVGVLSFACSASAGGMLFGVSGLLLLILLISYIISRLLTYYFIIRLNHLVSSSVSHGLTVSTS